MERDAHPARRELGLTGLRRAFFGSLVLTQLRFLLDLVATSAHDQSYARDTRDR